MAFEGCLNIRNGSKAAGRERQLKTQTGHRRAKSFDPNMKGLVGLSLQVN